MPELEVSLSEEELSISLLLEEVLSESLEVEWLLEDESLESESESLEEEDEPAAAAAASCWAARILGSSCVMQVDMVQTSFLHRLSAGRGV